MSKSEKVSPDAAQETSVESPTGVSNIEHMLLKLNVNEHTEKKQNLTYLSWAWAWAQALKADPNANFEVHMFDGKPYIDVNGTSMVAVSVKMNGTVRTCHLPVMNSKNQPILIAGRTFKDKYGNEQVEKIDSFNVNTAIMRCMTKCLALFGLGLYIYAGEDLPEEEEVVEKKVEKKDPKPVAPEDTEESIMLFANGLMHHIDLQDSEAALRSYWKVNAQSLDKLKARFPEIHAEVLEAFKQRNLKLKGE